jgi:hypothetical protein
MNTMPVPPAVEAFFGNTGGQHPGGQHRGHPFVYALVAVAAALELFLDVPDAIPQAAIGFEFLREPIQLIADRPSVADTERTQEPLAVGVVVEDRPPLVAPGRHVMHGPFVFDPLRPRHAPDSIGPSPATQPPKIPTLAAWVHDHRGPRGLRTHPTSASAFIRVANSQELKRDSRSVGGRIVSHSRREPCGSKKECV